MLLDKIQSGFLLLETPQGFARIELSPRQRIYLLWTFRNFHHLSVLLLNSRQRELVNSLFRHDAEVMADVADPDIVIGVVENFVPPTAATSILPAPKLIREKVQPGKVRAQPAAIARRPEPASQPAISVSCEQPRAVHATTGLATTEVAAARLPVSLQPTMAQRNRRKLARTRLATAFAALCLCVGCVAAWYRIQGLPVSQAHDQQTKAVAVSSPNFVEAEARAQTSSAQNPAVAPTAVGAEGNTAPEAALDSASITAAVPTLPPTPVATAAPKSNPAVRFRDAASTSDAPISSQDSSIQASRAPVYSVYPDYPQVQVRGAVSLQAGLDSAGNVRTVKLISGKHALAAAAIRAVRQWRYRPYLKDGKAVATETYVVISFISDDVVSMSYPPSIPSIH